MHWLLLSAAALVGGAVNAIAGGGMLVVFPAMIGSGMTPLMANATSTAALIPGSASAVWGYKQPLKEVRTWAMDAILPSIVGGALGAVLLWLTPAPVFKKFVPLLVLAATLLFVFQGQLGRTLAKVKAVSLTTPLTRQLVQFVIAIYWGYFGAGAGIFMMAIWAIAGLTNIHQLNALKMWSAVWTNVTAAVIFGIVGLVDWRVAGAVAIASSIGGFGLARFAQRLPHGVVRGCVSAVGFVSSVWLAVEALR
ncbi:MAG TPA: sulfite exporter TauE/SafE family protein [Gemmatimonadaceae bacterium]